VCFRCHERIHRHEIDVVVLEVAAGVWRAFLRRGY
jgi:hypothetical protein